MTTPEEAGWALDSATKAKQLVVKDYLETWLRLVGPHTRYVTYIDGACGPGRYTHGEPGTALVALEVAIRHQRILPDEVTFWFIDDDPRRVDDLRRELSEVAAPSRFQIHLRTGKFDQAVLSALAGTPDDSATVALMSPFAAAHVRFALIERLLCQRKAELFIDFSVAAVDRRLRHAGETEWARLAEVFGVQDVRDAAAGSMRIEQLRNLYLARLSAVAKFVHCFELRDREQSVLSYLMFASNRRAKAA